MKKKISIIIILSMLCTALFSGCGTEEALDLRGTWSDLSDGTQMAVIDDDTITGEVTNNSGIDSSCLMK